VTGKKKFGKMKMHFMSKFWLLKQPAVPCYFTKGSIIEVCLIQSMREEKVASHHYEEPYYIKYMNICDIVEGCKET
jgi:hypothetical protein